METHTWNIIPPEMFKSVCIFTVLNLFAEISSLSWGVVR